MREISTRFLEEVRASHTPAFSIAVEGVELPVADGSVTQDAQSSTLASMSLSLAPAEWELDDYVPDDLGDLLAPAGTEIAVKRGVLYSDGTTELVPLGVFGIDDWDGEDSGENIPINIEGLDRSARIIEAVFETAGQTISGATPEAEIERLITDVFPDCPMDLFVSDVTIDQVISWEQGDDRWDFCRGLAEAAACILYFDALGTLIMEKLVISSTPALEIAEGENGTLLKVGKRISRANAVNRVVVTGETSSEDPVIGEAIDNDPESPTYYYGDIDGFGRVTFSWSSVWVTTEAKANDVAQTILDQKLGLGQEIRFDSLANPALEVYDTVRVVRERMKVSELHIVDSIEFSLTSPEMSCATRMSRLG